MTESVKLRVAILGTGNIGTDLLYKLLRLKTATVVAFVGRRPSTKALPEGVQYFDNSIDHFVQHPHCCDIVFDCTDAYSAVAHARVFQAQNITVIDLTPSHVGQFCVPNVNCHFLLHMNNINMVTCGGQVAIPLLKYLSSRCVISYAEVISQISAESAGMATRINVDKYIETTEQAIKALVGISNCKVILNINPCETTAMQTTVFLKASPGSFDDFESFVAQMRSYVPTYEVTALPTFDPVRRILMVSVKIMGVGDYLSKYAGNLDVINCAAIELTQKIALLRTENKTPKVTNSYNVVLDI